MAILDLLNRAKATATNRLSGRSDILEAAAAAGALVAAAEGGIDSDEEDAIHHALETSTVLTTSFAAPVIRRVVDTMLDKADKGSRSGKNALLGEVRQVVGADKELRELVLLTALDVADKGGIGERERVVLERIAGELSLKLGDYDF